MQISEKFPKPRGHLTVQVFNKGQMVEEWPGDNIIVDLARDQMARLFGGDVTNRSITQVGFGTNASPPSTGNSGLTGAYLKTLPPTVYPSNYVAEFLFSLGTTEANGTAISEFGLLTASGILIARRVRATPIVKTSDISLSGTWRIEF